MRPVIHGCRLSTFCVEQEAILIAEEIVVIDLEKAILERRPWMRLQNLLSQFQVIE